MSARGRTTTPRTARWIRSAATPAMASAIWPGIARRGVSRGLRSRTAGATTASSRAIWPGTAPSRMMATGASATASASAAESPATLPGSARTRTRSRRGAWLFAGRLFNPCLADNIWIK
ncbi:hypothetical protein DL89DRAFT_45669 [Linderina pennispora]|uniref:Uncharacterized protein n=1 Tax=Linderina pennispora TaxID=61395 RepID=A0A1Y1W201_9FUNG|nr:uncharacterized protein DL89DRAFT_45669 [Linderina pennispora]ORX67507.1 hypothetical protein DL89DRAFT_45669 [Linderina pennispora]